ncbi:hypothetical protein CMV_028289 [Castanea mollissima]|uniref:Uncharacterized protein n=1 Tax=Castanea mollissima TaxID=60419 RepID=A0A8J4QHP2_9ROSI|nr:hypothetical protein CMV_028289 [Castanea mollissima]
MKVCPTLCHQAFKHDTTAKLDILDRHSSAYSFWSWIFSFCTSNTLIIIYQRLLSLDLVNSLALTRLRKADLRNFGSWLFLKYLKEQFKVHLSWHRVSGVQKLKTKMSGGNVICIFNRQFSLLH